MSLILMASFLLPFSFNLHNWDGKEISPATLRGKVFIVTFTYANCVKLFACSIVTINLKALDEKLGSPKDINYIHITVDPEADNPKIALDYLKKHGIDPKRDKRWLFLLGKREEIEPVLKGFGVSVKKMPMEGIGYLIEHTPKVLIYGRAGEVIKELNTFNFKEKDVSLLVGKALYSSPN